MRFCTCSFALLCAFGLAFISFLAWDHRFEFAQDGGQYACMERYMFEGIVFNDSISDKYRKPKDRSNCLQIKPQNVKILGVITTHHKTGTILHTDFYRSICAQMGINFIYMGKISIQLTQQQHSYMSLVLAHMQQVHCRDYHKCNNRALIQSKITNINLICTNLGVKCEDWFDIVCVAVKCAKLIKVNPSLRIVNPIRNPFDLVISTYLYHSGEAHELWAKETPMRELGFSFPEEINNMTVNQAINSLSAEIGLEISFQVVSDVLKGMVIFSEMEKQQSNVKCFKFENILNDFHAAMSEQLEFVGIFKEGDSEQNKRSVTKYGEWVMSKEHKVQLNRISHITAKQKTSKKFLLSILAKHDRAHLLNQIALILGYKNYTKE